MSTSPSLPQGLPQEPISRPAAARVRRRVLERVADTDVTHITIAEDEGRWQPFAEGVSITVLREHEGTLTYLLRLAPSARLPAHRHPQDEECLVLEGRLRVGSHTESRHQR